MSVSRFQVRRGAYYDSVVLLQLQKALAGQPGVEEVGVAMATPANRALLAETGLLPSSGVEALADDLIVAVRARDQATAEAAIAALDELLRARRGGDGATEQEDPRPRSLETALRLQPSTNWVLISVPGRHAAAVARQALGAGRNVFLYSDNVTLAEEVALKREAAERGLLVLGPDCGTAILNGAGLGFANRVRRGAIGIVAASGTGLQAVASRIDELGEGISHALGTGGRDLSREIGGATALAALALLAGDRSTRVITLLSKPPAPEVATRLLAAARDTGKPVVIHFLGHPAPGRRLGNLHFATSLADAADLAVALARGVREIGASAVADTSARPPGLGKEGVVGPRLAGTVVGAGATRTRVDLAPLAAASVLHLQGREGGGIGYSGGSDLEHPREAPLVRGLFSGGTLGYEALLALRAVLGPVDSNLSHDAVEGDGHRLLDLGADEFTVGRPHPMIDQDFLLRSLRAEAADRRVGVILLDVVLGDGAHADPAAGLAPTIAEVVGRARSEERELAVVVILVGTDADPQERAGQRQRLAAAGARVTGSMEEAIVAVWEAVAPTAPAADSPAATALDAALAVANVGVELFFDALRAQGVPAVQVDWRPPARGNERLAGLVERMRR